MMIPMPAAHPSTSARLVSTEGRVLPLAGAALRADARGGLARLTLEQRFVNPHAEPLAVTYKLPLPADGAVGGFAFRIGDRRIVGRVDGKQQARAFFEQAVLDGKTAALLEEERSSLFTQELGNIPPGATIVAEIDIDLPLKYLAEGYWELRFPLAAAPRYLGSASVAGDVSLDVSTGDPGARVTLDLAIRDAIAEGRAPESPTHAIVPAKVGGRFQVALGGGGSAMLDRDLVVRWPAAALEPGATIDVARAAGEAGAGALHGLLTLVPPLPEAGFASVPRDLTLLLDTSGSMSGEPLEQMKRITCAVIDGMGPNDSLELIEFSMVATAWRAKPEAVTPATKKDALRWVRALEAGGGTEMLTGVKQALRSLRPGAQRQVVMVTDGLVGFERDIVGAILAGLPETARFHAVGVGSAVNRSLVAPIARAGRGVEIVVGLGEDPERAAERLFSHLASPVVVDLSIEGAGVRSIAPSRLPDLFAAAPARIAVELAPQGGEIVVRGRTANGSFERRLRVAPADEAHGSAAVPKLFARELVEDLEMRVASGEGGLDREIERIGKLFAISTRVTSWVAATEEAMVDPRDPSRHQVQPQALAYGMSAEGLGLRQPEQHAFQGFAGPAAAAPAPSFAASMGRSAPPGMGFGGPARKPSPTGAPPPPPPPAPGRARMVAPAIMAGQKAKSEKEAKRDAGPTRFEAPRESASDAPTMRDEGAAPPSPQQSEEKPSILGRVAKAVTDLFRSADAVEPSPEAAPSEADDVDLEIAADLVLAGRILKSDDRGAVIELELEGETLLDFGSSEVTVTLEDGTEVTATVRVDASTREGRHPAGLRIRVAIALDAPAPSPIGQVRVRLPAAMVRGRAVIILASKG
jgi:Ca-activated chloride channel family protein